MRILIIFLLLALGGCSQEQAEEFAFRKTMEFQLKDECEEDQDCITAVEEQIESCMQQSEWRKYLNDSENEEELNRFIRVFFPCFKDSNGNSYFDVE